MFEFIFGPFLLLHVFPEINYILVNILTFYPETYFEKKISLKIHSVSITFWHISFSQFFLMSFHIMPLFSYYLCPCTCILVLFYLSFSLLRFLWTVCPCLIFQIIKGYIQTNFKHQLF